MGNKYFDKKDSLYNIIKKYEVVLDMLINIGFNNLKDEKKIELFAKKISFEDALKLKGIDVDVFSKKVVDKLKDENIEKHKNNLKTVKILGVLPCPVKNPLTEAFDNWLGENDRLYNVEYNLKAASVGLDWIKDDLSKKDVENIPDIFISAGFDVFFDRNFFGRYKSKNLFEDITKIDEYNKDLYNLKDPDKQYSVIAVVPAVFLINTNELKGRKFPSTWQDILSKEYRKSVSLPVGDFDLFNALLLNIYKKYGKEGIEALKRNMQEDMHPSQMVKSHTKKEKPAITIMPYFFTKMIGKNSPMKPVWPEDGAIISPIFMLTKKREDIDLGPIAKFFASKEIGEVLSHNGRFPSTNPLVDNQTAKNKKYIWLGWDYIKENEIDTLIEECESIFNNTSNGGEDK